MNAEYTTGRINAIECVREGFELIKSDYWLLLAVWIVGGVISGASFLIAAGAMMAGTIYAYLRKIDGHRADFNDLWKGFQCFFPGLVVVFVIVLPIMAVYLLIYVPILIAAISGDRMDPQHLLTMMIGVLVVDLILIIFIVCLHTLLLFAFPLMVDRGLGPITAMSTSARAVLRNLWGVSSLMAANIGLTILGYAALCVGIYFVIPVIIGSSLVAYRRVFPRLNPPTHGGFM
jgi:hypothetical protein